MNKTFFFRFLLIFFFLPAYSEVNAMSNMYIFSEVKGTVLSHGKPIAGAIIERSYKLDGKSKSMLDSTRTSTEGDFLLPAIFNHSLLRAFLPHGALIDQSIIIKHDGKTYQAWLKIKSNYRENGEIENAQLIGRPISLLCRLESEFKVNSKEEFSGLCELR